MSYEYSVAMIKNEIDLLRKFKDSPYVIKFIETFDFDEGSEKNHQTYIVTEIANETFDKYFTYKYDAYSKLKKDEIKNDNERMNYFCQMVEGIKEMHS